MDSLLKGALLSDDESVSGEDLGHNDDENRKEAVDDGAHTGLLESIGKSLGAKVNHEKYDRKRNLRISEYQSIPTDDRGPLPAFRGIKTARDSKKKRKKLQKARGENEETDVQDVLDEVFDDPTVTKPALAKAQRVALYEHTKKDVSKWNSIVYHNRVADQLVFPISAGEKISTRSIKDSVQEFVPQTPLEEEIAKILYGEDYVAKKKAELHSKDEKSSDEVYKLSIQEAIERHNDLARLRAIQSYEIAKAKRRNKIKSKKYHRLLRKEKIKKQMKEFEELKKSDPEAALKKLQELDVTRARERMTLKHRNTSKWAKSQAARAKYDKDARIALAEQLKISKELTQKVEESSSDEGDEDLQDDIKKGMKDGDAYQVKDYSTLASSEPNVETSQGYTNPGQAINLVAMRTFATPETAPTITVDHSKPVLDPQNYLVLNSKFKSDSNAIVVNPVFLNDDQDPEDGDPEDQRMVIAEAFEDDDVVSEFHKKKADEIEASHPKDLDLTLPGWGAWGGKGIKPSKKKLTRFRRKAPPPPPRKDAKLSHVIIHEGGTKKLKEHQVRELPFPFQRVKDFEKIIRAPIGRTWLPERAMKDLTAPKLITKLGTIIKPISEDALVKKSKTKPFNHQEGHVKLVAGVVKKRT